MRKSPFDDGNYYDPYTKQQEFLTSMWQDLCKNYTIPENRPTEIYHIRGVFWLKQFEMSMLSRDIMLGSFDNAVTEIIKAGKIYYSRYYESEPTLIIPDAIYDKWDKQLRDLLAT